MRKIFLLLPALVLSLFANAATVSVSPGNNTIRAAITASTTVDGDVLVLADGTYTDDNYIELTKSVEIVADEGAAPIIELNTYIKVSGGKHVILDGLYFDGNAQGDRDQYFRFTDSGENELIIKNCTFANVKKNIFRCESSNKFTLLDVQNCTFSGSLKNVCYLESSTCGTMKFDGCEFANTAERVIHIPSTAFANECIINNCYFHNNIKSCICLENTTAMNLTVTNSTFAENTAPSSNGIIDTKTTGEVTVDHCTFYNCPVSSTDYGAIKIASGATATVSNNIIAMPSATGSIRAIHMPDGFEVKHCLVFNYTNDGGQGIRSGNTKTNCLFVDPLFDDLANNKYSYSGDWTTTPMSLSPARGAATDGSDLGDPRWYSAEVLPETDFASPYVLTGDKAKLTGKVAIDASNYLQFNNNSDASQHGVAIWKVRATRSCYLQATLNIDAENTSGHRYQIEVFDSSNTLIGTAIGESADSWEKGDKVISDLIMLSVAGDYKIKLSNLCDNSSNLLHSITLSYIGGDIQAMPGTTNIADAWFSANGTRADGKISFPGSTIQDGWVKWNVSFANTGNYDVTLNINSNNCKNYTVALVDANDANVVTPLTLNDCSTTGTPVALAMGAMEVPAGNYILKVTNATQNSDAELISVNFAYTGGGIIDIPGTIALNEAILSERAFIDGDGLHFVDAEHLWLMSEGYAKWNIHVAADGIYKFTANCNSSNYSNLTIQVLQGGEEKYTYTPEYSYSGEKTIVSPEWFLEAGNYELKLSNPANNSNGYLVSLIATAEENVFILDENTTDDGSIAAAAGNTYKFLLKRSFTAGKYYTICLPVGSWDSELKLAFGADYELWKMSSATQSGDEISLNFELCNTESFHAGWPYLIKPSIDVQNPVFHNLKTIQNSTYNNVQSFAAADFIGSFYKTVIPAGESNLYLQNNKLYYSETNDTPIKGTRAWIQLKQSGSLAPARAHIVLLNQVVTNIQLAEPEENKAIKTIENGQLIIIRDGVRYNAMGVVMK